MNVSLVIPRHEEFFEISTEAGGKKKIPLAKQKQPSNLLIAKFKVEQLPESLKEILYSSYPLDRLSTIPLYKLPKGAFVNDLLILPLSEDCELIGVYGFVFVHNLSLLEGSQTRAIIYKRNENIQKRFILYEIRGEIVAIHERKNK